MNLSRCDESLINLLDLTLDDRSKETLVRYFSDKTTYLEVLLTQISNKDLYSEFIFPNMENVIDIGANVGIFTLFVAPFCRNIYSIEPTPNHFKLLEMLTENDARIKPIQVAIGGESGKKEFFNSPLNQTSNSFFKEDGGTLLESVDVLSLKDFFQSRSITSSDFVKLDAEGAEVQIITDESFQELNGKIKTLYIEVHNINNGPHQNSLQVNLEIVSSRLKTLGYSTQIKNIDTIIARWP